MMYYDFEVGNKSYKLRLNTRNTIALEKALGCNPLSVFGDGNTLPTISQMVNILWASLQAMHHGISINDAYDIGCKMQRKRVECAIMIKAAEADME